MVLGRRTLGLGSPTPPSFSLKSDVAQPSVPHMFCSKAFLLSVICLKLHLEFFLRYKALKVPIILICPIKQLVVCG